MCLSSLDEAFKSSSYLTETLLDPEFGHASEANKAAFNRAHNIGEDMWSWFERPDNKLRLARFGASMEGVRNTISADSILEGSVIARSFEGRYVTQIYSHWQGTPGRASPKAHLLSMLEAALARNR
jgi:hypothetical protein